MMQKRIFVINGTGGAGKDTFISFIEGYTKVMNYSSVEVIKSMARLVGWNGEKDEKSRAFLSNLKQVVNDYNRYPVTMMSRKIREFQDSDAEFLFLHIREAEEIEILKKEFELKTVLIKRTGIIPITSNQSDAGVDNYCYDYVIENDGDLEHFREQAITFAERQRAELLTVMKVQENK